MRIRFPLALTFGIAFFVSGIVIGWLSEYPSSLWYIAITLALFSLLMIGFSVESK